MPVPNPTSLQTIGSVSAQLCTLVLRNWLNISVAATYLSQSMCTARRGRAGCDGDQPYKYHMEKTIEHKRSSHPLQSRSYKKEMSDTRRLHPLAYTRNPLGDRQSSQKQKKDYHSDVPQPYQRIGAAPSLPADTAILVTTTATGPGPQGVDAPHTVRAAAMTGTGGLAALMAPGRIDPTPKPLPCDEPTRPVSDSVSQLQTQLQTQTISRSTSFKRQSYIVKGDLQLQRYQEQWL
ncbi:hypothetical protein FRC09_007364 [Ceratobasidium sp. 395]|nr:hypothetical protein FRC09_007364 [Ceratobasidium sp. 395]